MTTVKDISGKIIRWGRCIKCNRVVCEVDDKCDCGEDLIWPEQKAASSK